MMSTHYVISVGYNAKFAPAVVWEELTRTVSELCENPQLIVDEAFAVDQWADRELLEEVAELYRHTDYTRRDAPVRILDDDMGLRLVQYASGRAPYRTAKEACRRAFCRLVMRAMHARGMEININVT